MKNGQWIVAGIMGLAVVLAAMIAGTPTGVADSPQPPQWEVATAGLDRQDTSPSDSGSSIFARVDRLEQRVANLERSGLDTPAPTPPKAPAAAAVPPSPIVSTEGWQEYTVVDVPAVVYSQPVVQSGQYKTTTTITTQQCTGGSCRTQATPVRNRLFRR